MQSSVRNVADAILKTRRRLGRTTLVAISGIDCAGKTTFARALAAEVGAVIVSGDDFHRPTSERHEDDLDHWFAYDDLVRELLVPVRAGGRVEAVLRVKDWEHDVWDERTFVVEPGSIVVVEGVFLFTRQLLPLFDLTVWLEISFDDALARALERDAGGMGGPEGVRERYATRYFPAQQLHLERDRPQERADIVLHA